MAICSFNLIVVFSVFDANQDIQPNEILGFPSSRHLWYRYRDFLIKK